MAETGTLVERLRARMQRAGAASAPPSKPAQPQARRARKEFLQEVVAEVLSEQNRQLIAEDCARSLARCEMPEAFRVGRDLVEPYDLVIAREDLAPGEGINVKVDCDAVFYGQSHLHIVVDDEDDSFTTPNNVGWNIFSADNQPLIVTRGVTQGAFAPIAALLQSSVLSPFVWPAVRAMEKGTELRVEVQTPQNAEAPDELDTLRLFCVVLHGWRLVGRDVSTYLVEYDPSVWGYQGVAGDPLLMTVVDGQGASIHRQGSLSNSRRRVPTLLPQLAWDFVASDRLLLTSAGSADRFDLSHGATNNLVMIDQELNARGHRNQSDPRPATALDVAMALAPTAAARMAPVRFPSGGTIETYVSVLTWEWTNPQDFWVQPCFHGLRVPAGCDEAVVERAKEVLCLR